MGRRRQPALPGTRNLGLYNRQHLRKVNLRLLRRIVHALLWETCPHVPIDLAVYVVAAPEITRLNETFLHHRGSTDVITFDYAEPARPSERRLNSLAPLHGEILVCVEEAISQARRFHTRWQSELVRYTVHGVLHLLGYDDLTAPARRRIKAAENGLLRQLAQQFDFRGLGPAG